MVSKNRQRLRDRNQPTGQLQARLADANDKILSLLEENKRLSEELSCTQFARNWLWHNLSCRNFLYPEVLARLEMLWAERKNEDTSEKPN